MLCFETLRKQRTNTNRHIAGSSCGRVSVFFGFLCHLWLRAIMSTSSAHLQGWGGSCKTELSWLSIWQEEAACGTPLFQIKENTVLTICISPPQCWGVSVAWWYLFMICNTELTSPVKRTALFDIWLNCVLENILSFVLFSFGEVFHLPFDFRGTVPQF